MFELARGAWAAAKFGWKHRKTLARLGDAQEAIEEAEAVRAENSVLQEEIAGLEEENRQLRDQIKFRQMKFGADGMYWDGYDGPFCPKCADGDGKRARVAQNPANLFWVCNVCGESPVGSPKPRDWY